MNTLDNLVFATHKYHKEIHKICEPFHRLFGTNHVGYLNISSDHNVINLHTNPKWLDRCMEEKYFLQDPCMVNPKNIEEGMAFYFTYDDDRFTNGIIKDSIENFDMSHELVFVNKNAIGGFEVVSIAAPHAHSKIYNKILQYPKHLQNFVEHFKLSLKPLINKVEDYRINLADLKGDNYHNQQGFLIDNPFEQKHAENLQKHCQSNIEIAV